jgi:predicted nuclease of predicted toxin-antitoxin system
MKFLIDMNLSPAWVPFLASHGFEAVHWATVGSPSAPDPEILERVRAVSLFLLVTWTSEQCFTPGNSPNRA